jgi:ubiquinone/menaquinone biosynthesis C-methylase UbiE
MGVATTPRDILVTVHHGSMSDANPRGGDLNLRSGPQMEEYRAIVDRIRSDRPATILDWGSGHGQVSNLLHEAGLAVTAFDYQPDAPDGLRPMERYPHLSVHLGSHPCRLPFDDGSFAAVLSCGVLEHVADPDTSLEEIKRVMAPEGTLYVYKLPNRRSYLEAIARRMGLYYHGACQHDKLYDLPEAIELLRRHGFEVGEARRMNVLPLSLTGDWADRSASLIWKTNRRLSAVPGLNMIATNIELVAHSPVTLPPGPRTSR